MRIIFMGTPQFAVASLQILIENNYQVVAVVTMPDKPAGRGQQVQTSAVKQFAVQHSIPVLQPQNLKEESFLQELKRLKPDLQLVVAFRMLPELVWNLPPLGTYNLHASLLPQYRGAAPINWALINGEQETGITTFKLQHEIDTGSILMQEKVMITPDMNAGQLHDILMMQGAQLLLKSVQKIQNGNYTLQEQNNNNIKHAPKIFRETCQIVWDHTVEKIHNHIRGLSPYPCAWTTLEHNQKQVVFKIYETVPDKTAHNSRIGTIHSDGKTYLKVAVLNGFVFITELQMAGKKKLRISEFLKGFSFKPDDRFL
ncbi:MAG: methionyl-tRNA formyltransferase [Bacteroidetes bacterium]|nr:methionyl-tRNA formyltransferase [Bacteroidota bacterium]